MNIKLCNKCESENENYKHEDKNGHYHKVFVLLRCKSYKCLTFNNRDDNSALNMIKITKEILKNQKKPYTKQCVLTSVIIIR